MSIYVGYPSALEYLRQATERPGLRPRVLERALLEDASAGATAVRAAGLVSPDSPVGLDAPVSLLLPNDLGRSRSPLVAHRTWSRPLPVRSLCSCEVLPGVFASTPGFCLLQAASSLAFEDLMQLVLELCGTYSSGARSTEERCRLTPLTTRRSLEGYLAGAGAGKAALRARRAVGLAVDGAGSPMEAVTYLILSLPVRYGGYGLPAPLANMRIDLPPDLQACYEKQYVMPDLCWPRARLAVEYDSDEHHTGGRKASRDYARATLLRAMGYEVHSTNKALLDDERSVGRLVSRIAKVLGVRVERRVSEGELERRRLLRSRLLDRSRDWKHTRRMADEPDAARRR